MVKLEEENRIGVVTGLAWTEVGGEILKIESAVMPGKGKMQITGKLGDIMQNLLKQRTYIRSKARLRIIPPIFDKKDFHIVFLKEPHLKMVHLLELVW